MAADQERADRIRALKQGHPELTWQAIAERVGVSLRAAQSWQETGGIAYENAKRLAALWGEDVDYIMRGERPETPDLSLSQVRDASRREHARPLNGNGPPHMVGRADQERSPGDAFMQFAVLTGGLHDAQQHEHGGMR
jgi:hypothetical protein